MQIFHLEELKSDSSYKATLKGDIFQLKLLIAVALRAYTTGASKFILNTEVTAAEKFDDLVIEYPNSVTVLQAKHSTRGIAYKKVDFTNSKKGEASLPKYFDSFVRITEKKTFGDKPVNYLFFTNRQLADDDFFSSLIAAEEPDENLTFETGDAKCWKFRKRFCETHQDYKEIYAEIKSAIKSHSGVYYQWLSQDLTIDMNSHKKEIEKSFRNLIIYIVNEMKRPYQSKQAGEFEIKFSRNQTEVRNLLLSVLQRLEENSPILKLTAEFIGNENLTGFQQWIRKKFLDNLQEELECNKDEAIQLLQRMQFQYPKDIAGHVWQSQDKSKGTKVNEADIKKSQQNILTWKPTTALSYLLVGMFGEWQFKYNPEKDCPLADLTIYKTLHKAILEKIEAIGGADVDAVEEKFDGYLTRFFKEFRIKSGQPNEDELEKILFTELNATFNFSGPEYYAQFFHQMLNWMKDIRGKFITRQILSAWFKKITAGIQQLHLTGYSQHATNILKEYQAELVSEEVIAPIAQFVIKKATKKFVLLLSGEDALGLTLASCQMVKQLQLKTQLTQDNWAFVSPECRIIDKVVEVLEERCDLLIMDNAAELAGSGKVLDEIINAAITHKKKLILLCSMQSLDKVKEKIPTMYLDECTLQNLSDARIQEITQSHKDKKIYIAGRYLSIDQILEHKIGGVYHSMRFLSRLMAFLQHAIDPIQLARKKPLRHDYVPQQVQIYHAFYNLKHVISKLPQQHVLLIMTDDFKDVESEITEKIKLSYKKIVAYSKEKKADEELDAFDIFKECSETDYAKEKQKQHEKVKPVIMIDLTKRRVGQYTNRILSYLRKNNYCIIVIDETAMLDLANLICIPLAVTKLTNTTQISVSLEHRHYFDQPTYQLQESSKPTAYTAINFLSRQPHNLTTAVTANPGTGKSENFRELVKVWASQDELQKAYHWLVHVNLIDVDENFLVLPLSEILVKYVYKSHLQPLTEAMRKEWIAIIEYDIQHGMVKLLLDGWDEIKGSREGVVKKFIAKLPETIHYDIAMRPYVFASAPCKIYQRVELQIFSEDDLRKYLKLRFQATSEDSIVDEKKLLIFIEEILQWLKSADESMWDVVKIPLLAFLLSEALQNDWQDWLNSEEEKPQGPWNNIAILNLLGLYEFFILEKARIYLRQHVGISRIETLSDDKKVCSLIRELLETMEEIAFTELFNLPVVLRPLSQEIYRSLLDFGIITGQCEEQIDDKIEYRAVFMQQTFKELFAALHIVRMLSRGDNDPSAEKVKVIITRLRYENSYKVVWRFVRDLLKLGSVFLPFEATQLDAFAFFSKPMDLIGVAQSNLLFQLGLQGKQISIREMRSSVVALPEVAEENVSGVMSVDDIQALLVQIKKSIGNKDEVINLISELPADIPHTLYQNYYEIFTQLLKSWWYRIAGHAAEKISKTNIELPLDFLKLLFDIAKDKRCHLCERQGAIRATLKITKKHLPAVFEWHKELLLNKSLDDEVKIEILQVLQLILPNDALDESVIEFMKDNQITGKVNNEVQLRRLLLIKICSEEEYYFKTPIVELAKSVVVNLSESRLELLFSLIKQEFISLDEIKDALVKGICNYDNRHIAKTLLKKLCQYLKEQDLKADFLEPLFSEKENPSLGFKGTLVKRALLMVKEGSLKGDRTASFWRVDAGMPMAKFLVFETLCVETALPYLVCQIRNYSSAYGVNNKINELFSDIKNKNSMQRCKLLYLVFEYLVHKQINNERFSALYNSDGLLRQLIEIAWIHFSNDRHYPLIGLDVIFTIGVCYGLPLIFSDSQFNLLLVNVTNGMISSPKFNSHQCRTIEKYFDYLRDISGKSFDLESLRDSDERDSINISSINLDLRCFDRSTMFAAAPQATSYSIIELAAANTSRRFSK